MISTTCASLKRDLRTLLSFGHEARDSAPRKWYASEGYGQRRCLLLSHGRFFAIGWIASISTCEKAQRVPAFSAFHSTKNRSQSRRGLFFDPALYRHWIAAPHLVRIGSGVLVIQGDGRMRRSDTLIQLPFPTNFMDLPIVAKIVEPIRPVVAEQDRVVGIPFQHVCSGKLVLGECGWTARCGDDRYWKPNAQERAKSNASAHVTSGWLPFDAALL